MRFCSSTGLRSATANVWRAKREPCASCHSCDRGICSTERPRPFPGSVTYLAADCVGSSLVMVAAHAACCTVCHLTADWQQACFPRKQLLRVHAASTEHLGQLAALNSCELSCSGCLWCCKRARASSTLAVCGTAKSGQPSITSLRINLHSCAQNALHNNAQHC